MTYRELSAAEQKLITRIVNHLPVRRPVGFTLKMGEQVREIFSDGSICFKSRRGNEVEKQKLYPVEAQYVDDDGVPVNALIFFVHDEVSMLEIVKADGSKISRKPPPEEWEILDLS